MPTQEDLATAFEGSITDMQAMVLKAVQEGRGDLVSPTVMMVMRTVPDLKGSPLEFVPFTSNSESGGVQIGIFSPLTLTPPGLSRMPKNVFWQVMKLIAHISDAYGTIVGMEAWIARAQTAEEAAKVPASLEDYDKREEAVVVTAERDGEYHLYQAFMKRDGEKLTFAPWEKHVTNSAAPAGSTRESRANEPKSEGLRLSGDVFRSIPANMKN